MTRDELSPIAWTEQLAHTPIFAGLSKRQVRAIARLGEMRRYQPRHPVVQAGRPGDAFFLVLEGSVLVRRPGRPPVRIPAGGFFGELSLFDGAPRTATVEVADEDEVLVMKLPRSAFLRALHREPRIAVSMLEVVTTRLRELDPTAI
jgi:CRP-like cAMP-binding protein